MKVSFIIPLYNCLHLTQAMLASLRETLPPGLDCEIILVDDGSTDGTRDWLKNLPSPCRAVLHEKNLGFAAACNHGAATATGEFLFFLNNDLIPLPRWLEPMLAVFDRFPASGLVGNVQLNAATGTVDHTGIFFNHQGKPAHRTDLSVTTRWFGWPAYREIDALTGACFGLRRSAWQQLGGFDEAYLNGSEDIDLALRASTAGLHHYIALGSVVRHHISSSAGRNLRDEQNSQRLMQRWTERIVVLAARDWSRHFIEQHWDQSFLYDDILGRQALYCWLGLLPAVPAGVRTGVRAALAVEFARWRRLAT